MFLIRSAWTVAGIITGAVSLLAALALAIVRGGSVDDGESGDAPDEEQHP